MLLTQLLPPAPRALAEQAMRIAQGYADAHVHEEGGNNHGDQVGFFQHLMRGSAGDPWCADFVSTCLVKAYAQLSGQPEGREDLPKYVAAVSAHYFRLSGYCPDLAAAAKERGLLRGNRFDAQPGDIVLYDFQGQGEPHHVEIVRAMGRGRAVGRILTLGGNTSGTDADSKADGGGVFACVRPLNHIFGFIHLG